MGGGVGGTGRGGVGFGGQRGCERRIEVFGRIQKKIRGRGGREGVWGSGGGRVGGGQDGCERHVGGTGDVGYGRCEPRIEGIVQYKKGIVQY